MKTPLFLVAQVASYTTERISPEHIGMVGTLIQSKKGSLADRIQQEPGQFIKGLVKLIMVVALAVILIWGSIVFPSVKIAVISCLAFETALAICRIVVPLFEEVNLSLPSHVT